MGHAARDLRDQERVPPSIIVFELAARLAPGALVCGEISMARERVDRALRGMGQRLTRRHDGGAGAVRTSGDDTSAFCGCLHDLDA